MIAELVRDEGERLRPYLDSASPPRITIGVGRNLTDRGISRDEMYMLLDHDIDFHAAQLDLFLPYWRKLDEVRQRVLLNMAFNLGVDPHTTPPAPPGRLLEFRNTLALIETGDYSAAADHMKLSAWYKQVGIRAVRLSDMMRRGTIGEGG